MWTHAWPSRCRRGCVHGQRVVAQVRAWAAVVGVGACMAIALWTQMHAWAAYLTCRCTHSLHNAPVGTWMASTLPNIISGGTGLTHGQALACGLIYVNIILKPCMLWKLDSDCGEISTCIIFLRCFSSDFTQPSYKRPFKQLPPHDCPKPGATTVTKNDI
eukprot:366278-Chlamydomonas_euryale.AAC.58